MWVQLDLKKLDQEQLQTVQHEAEKQGINIDKIVKIIVDYTQTIRHKVDIRQLGDREYNLAIWSMIDPYYVIGDKSMRDFAEQLIRTKDLTHYSLFLLKFYDETKSKEYIDKARDLILNLNDFWAEDALALAKLAYTTRESKVINYAKSKLLEILDDLQKNGVTKISDLELSMGVVKGLGLLNINYEKDTKVIDKIAQFMDTKLDTFYDIPNDSKNIRNGFDPIEAVAIFVSCMSITTFVATNNIKYLIKNLKLAKWYQDYLYRTKVNNMNFKQLAWASIALSRFVYFIKNGKILD